jgi:lipopolysaccharide export system permease protein
MIRRLFHPLDRYVFQEFWRVFLVTTLGFPVLVEVLDLAENVDSYLQRKLPKLDIALSYLYWLPESMFLVLPAAVLFATVFTVGSLTRYSEITAAKASGLSFHRVIAPLIAGAAVATILGLALGELVPLGNQRRAHLLQSDRYARGNDRANFAFLSRDGRIYQIEYLRVVPSSIKLVQIDRLSVDPAIPNYITRASAGRYDSVSGFWRMGGGLTHVMPDSATSVTFAFDSIIDRRMLERPIELVKSSRAPDHMGYRELGNYIDVMERAGADMNTVRVERMLKIAIPVTCVIIALFGAPLATSSKRGGASFGIGISLASTVLFLLAINLTRGLGGKGVISPELAAWLPSILFGSFGLFMLARVRT